MTLRHNKKLYLVKTLQLFTKHFYCLLSRSMHEKEDAEKDKLWIQTLMVVGISVAIVPAVICVLIYYYKVKKKKGKKKLKRGI